jgi:hypothetical protein
MRADAEVAAEQLRQRLERLVGSSQEVTKQRSDMAQVGRHNRNSNVFCIQCCETRLAKERVAAVV